MRNHQIEVHRNIVPIVPVPPMKSTQTIEYQSLRGRNNKKFYCSTLFRGPIFQHFIVVFAAESPYLCYRQKKWIAPQEYTTNSTDDEAWQAQNETVRFRNRSVLGTQSNLHRFIRVRRKRFLKHPPKSQMERVFGRTNNHGQARTY